MDFITMLTQFQPIVYFQRYQLSIINYQLPEVYSERRLVTGLASAALIL